MTDDTEYDEILPRAEQDTRISSDEADDLPISPPDMQPRAGGLDGGDASPVEETIDQRIMQEEPDPDSAYGAPDNESGLDGHDHPLGGDDPDAIPADRDVFGTDPDAPVEDDVLEEELGGVALDDPMADPESAALTDEV